MFIFKGAEAFPRSSEIIGGQSGRDPATLSLNDETSSTSSEKYERDVTILNHCFDDIEKFIARLQHAAAASRELERRRKYVIFCGLSILNYFQCNINLMNYVCLEGTVNPRRKIWAMEC